VDAVWEDLLRGYQRPNMKLFKGQIQTGCGPADSSVGPFYCPADQTAYFDTDFFQVLKTQFGSSGGPLAEEYVVAHEYGHHVQNLTGDLSKAQRGAQGATGGGVRSELQADCYAGVWAHYAAITKQPGTDVTYLQPLTDGESLFDGRLVKSRQFFGIQVIHSSETVPVLFRNNRMWKDQLTICNFRRWQALLRGKDERV
jgi:predicted metalloprotease